MMCSGPDQFWFRRTEEFSWTSQGSNIFWGPEGVQKRSRTARGHSKKAQHSEDWDYRGTRKKIKDLALGSLRNQNCRHGPTTPFNTNKLFNRKSVLLFGKLHFLLHVIWNYVFVEERLQNSGKSRGPLDALSVFGWCKLTFKSPTCDLAFVCTCHRFPPGPGNVLEA